MYDSVITPEQLNEKINNGKELYLVDMRPIINHLNSINSSHHIQSSKILDNPDLLPKDKTVILYCGHGVDSFFLMNILIADYGFSDIFSLKSGLEGWYKFVDELNQ